MEIKEQIILEIEGSEVNVNELKIWLNKAKQTGNLDKVYIISQNKSAIMEDLK